MNSSISLKKILLIFIIFPVPAIAICQTSWDWAKSAIDSGGAEGWTVCTDSFGSVYIAGYYNNPSVIFGTYTLTNTSNSEDVFVAKYDSLGNVIWARSAGGPKSDYGYSVNSDKSGNIYLVGSFQSSSITFGSFTLINTDNSGNTRDVFIVKYDSAGNVIWAQSGGGSLTDDAYSVSVDSLDNAYLTGVSWSSSINFGNYTAINSGSANSYIVKYNALGNVSWVRSPTGNNVAWGTWVSSDINGNSYLTGYFQGPSITFGSITLMNSGSADFFLVKYDSSGAVIWAKSAGGTASDRGNAISLDEFGNIYVTGSFQGPNITFGSYTLTYSGNGANIFTVKYDSSGTALWAKSAVSNNSVIGYCVNADRVGDIYVTGSCGVSQINFGSLSLIPSSNTTDGMFIVKYDSNGNALCGFTLTSGGDDQNGVSTDNLGNVYITGDYATNPFVVGTDTLHLTGGESVFLAKFSCGKIMSVDELQDEISLQISPNPFVMQTVFYFKGQIKNAQLILYDVLGNREKEIAFSGKQVTIERGDMPSGIYFYQITSEEKQIATGKLIIQ